MSKHHESAGEAVEVLDRAHAVEIAIQQLCRAMLARPSMTPAEVDVVLARLAAVAAALPQAAQQLGDILQQTKGDYTLEMDTLTETQDPGPGHRHRPAPPRCGPRASRGPIPDARRGS